MSSKTLPRALAPCAILLASIAIMGCGGSSSSSSSAPSTSSSTSAASPAAGGKAVQVSIVNYAYKPVSVAVKVGTKLTFTNHDSTAHTATSTSPPLDTGSIGPGASGSVTVTKPGTYSYICTFHPFMHGTITVTS